MKKVSEETTCLNCGHKMIFTATGPNGMYACNNCISYYRYVQGVLRSVTHRNLFSDRIGIGGNIPEGTLLVMQGDKL